jgi:hypothetical protein
VAGPAPAQDCTLGDSGLHSRGFKITDHVSCRARAIKTRYRSWPERVPAILALSLSCLTLHHSEHAVAHACLSCMLIAMPFTVRSASGHTEGSAISPSWSRRTAASVDRGSKPSAPQNTCSRRGRSSISSTRQSVVMCSAAFGSDWHGELTNVGISGFGAEENLLRRGLMTDVHREPAPGVIDREHGESGHNGCERNERKRREPVRPPPGSQAATRHAQKARYQDYVCKELQKNDIGGKPADTGQLKKRTRNPTRNKLRPHWRALG